MSKRASVITNGYLIGEWNYQKNSEHGLTPEKITLGSARKVWWTCPEGHEYEMPIAWRDRGQNCPYCNRKRVLIGFNDLQSRYPDVAKYWHPIKNDNLSPTDVTYGSGKIVWWICDNNHEYRRSIDASVKSKGCPICQAFYKSSFPEQCFFYYIKQVYPDAVGRYHEPFLKNMELDIYIPSIKTGIEYDGIFWHKKEMLAREKKKYNLCKENGIRLFRIREGVFNGFLDNADRTWYVPLNCVGDDLDIYIIQILQQLTLTSVYCLPSVNVKRDRFRILEYLSHRDKSFASEFPNLVCEWDYEKNSPLKPENFSPYSNERVFWKCSICGKSWKTSIATRANSGYLGCKQCVSKQSRKQQIHSTIEKTGSLAEKYPYLLDEWDYANNTVDPHELLPNSREIVGWVCKKCGHHWKSDIAHRTRGHGCTLCSKQEVVAGINDLATISPELAKEWNYDKNTLTPNEVAPNSNRVYWWKCSTCSYEWEATLNNRFSKKSGCPCCSGRVVKKGVNDLKTLFPDIAKDWDYSKNDRTPEDVKRGSNYSAAWHCAKCGYEWEKSVKHRVKYPNCPNCHR